MKTQKFAQSYVQERSTTDRQQSFRSRRRRKVYAAAAANAIFSVAVGGSVGGYGRSKAPLKAGMAGNDLTDTVARKSELPHERYAAAC